MWHFIKVYVITIFVFLILDYIWLGRIMAGFYKEQLGTLARWSGETLTPHIPSAVVVYLLIPLGIVLFALPRVADEQLLCSALMWGFVYGIILYGVYDMTNYSVLAQWPPKLAFVDILWGGVVNSLATLAAAYADKWVK
jgi:uncharacterized membrane protein